MVARRIFGIGPVLIISMVWSCISPVDLPSDPPETLQLVVEGYITTDYGPHTISLSRTAQYGSVFVGIIRREDDATVVVRDDEGMVTVLNNAGQGKYLTNGSFKAEIGRSYSIVIRTQDGEEFISTPQRIVKGPELEEVDLRFKKFPGIDPFNFQSGVELYASFSDIPNEENYYLWSTSDGVYPWIAHPELYRGFWCPPVDFARKCFRYERNFNEFQPEYSFQPQCIIFPRTFFEFSLLSDKFRDGNEITQLAAFIEDDGRRFEFVYRVLLNQFTISKEAFSFYNTLQVQLDISGDIFDAPPANIGGNIIHISNPEVEALGFFGAFDVSSKEIYIDRGILEETQRKVRFANDCWKLDSSTLDTPKWWNGKRWY